MPLSILLVIGVLVGWSIISKWLENRLVTGPMVMVVAGFVIGLVTDSEIANSLNTHDTQRAVEVVLAILLFTDATQVKGGYFGGEGRSVLRLLLIALPLSIALALACGLILLPGLSWAAVLVIACIVVPSDFAPAASIVRDARISRRVRHILNVESGYNDGIISPVFVSALAVASTWDNPASTAVDALTSAIPASLIAVAVGAPIGGVVSWLLNRTGHRLRSKMSTRLGLVAIPLLAYGASLALEGNGFVAAFACGIGYAAGRNPTRRVTDLELVDDVGTMLAMGMYFIFGAACVLVIEFGIDWRVVLFAVLVLTVVRAAPAYACLLGVGLSRGDRLRIGFLGPRGSTSIVFGLIAFNSLDGESATTTITAMTAVLLGSVILHGIGAPTIARRKFWKPR